MRRAFLWGTLAFIVLFATGIPARPPGAGWDRAYDVVLYNLPYLPAAAACWIAGGRVRSERLAWRALAIALLFNASGNAVRTAVAGITGAGGTSAVADLLNALGYLTLYVTLIGMLRARVSRFHPSMWLDGLIGALGTLSVGVAFLLGPFLSATGHEPIGLVELIWPAADLLLLALVVAMGAILGVRLDRTLFTITGAMALVCTGDIVLFLRSVTDSYTDGGVLELTWLAGIALVAYAATCARPRPVT